VLHGWLQQELTGILTTLPPPAGAADPVLNRTLWESWREELLSPLALPEELPPLRMLLVLDNLRGHKTPTFVAWCVAQGILPLYTPLGGSWLNMAESFQRIIIRRALEGQYPQTPAEIIGWLETVVGSWNRTPTPFEWGGRRAARRARARARRHALGGSGAVTHRLVAYRKPAREKWRLSCQTTH